jgi:hypothetical protein
MVESGAAKVSKLPADKLRNGETKSGPGPPFQPVVASEREGAPMGIGPAIMGATRHNVATTDKKARSFITPTFS